MNRAKLSEINKKKNENKNQNCLDKILHDLKKSIYYNYNKKKFAKSCLKPLKNYF